MSLIYSKITHAARALPERVVTNEELSKMVDTSDEWIKSRTGISLRHISMTEEENNVGLGLRVGKSLLEKSGLSPDQIGLLIVSTLTPDYRTPSAACLIQNRLGADNAFAFDVNGACAGFIYALAIADKYIKSGVCKYAMVIGTEILSKITNWTDRNTCVLFGDGSGGVILEASDTPGIICEDLHSGGDADAIMGGFSPVCGMTPRESLDFDPVIMNGRSVFDFVVCKAPVSIRKVLEMGGITPEEVDIYIPHQANGRIIEALAKKMSLPLDKFYVSVTRYGNTSSSSIPIALSEMMDEGLVKSGDGKKLVFTAFGAGVTWGSILLQF